ncbi:MAG TPA: STAS domain-containing protein [Arenimonas sp.]|nr:STAS domain-containing protein [Arenimonas sp.]
MEPATATGTTSSSAPRRDPDGCRQASRLALSGSLSIYDVAALKTRLIDAVSAHAELELDLSAVESIDTAGVQLLMLAKLHAAARGHALVLVGHSPAVVDVFELFQLAGYFGDPIVLPVAAAGSKAS